MPDDIDCGCGWHEHVFVQCASHRAEVAPIVAARGEGSLWRFEYTVIGEMDTEIHERLKRGLRMTNLTARPLPTKHR